MKPIATRASSKTPLVSDFIELTISLSAMRL